MKKTDSIYIYIKSKINSFKSDNRGISAFEYIAAFSFMVTVMVIFWFWVVPVIITVILK